MPPAAFYAFLGENRAQTCTETCTEPYSNCPVKVGRKTTSKSPRLRWSYFKRNHPVKLRVTPPPAACPTPRAIGDPARAATCKHHVVGCVVDDDFAGADESAFAHNGVGGSGHFFRVGPAPFGLRHMIYDPRRQGRKHRRAPPRPSVRTQIQRSQAAAKPPPGQRSQPSRSPPADSSRAIAGWMYDHHRPQLCRFF